MDDIEARFSEKTRRKLHIGCNTIIVLMVLGFLLFVASLLLFSSPSGRLLVATLMEPEGSYCSSQSVRCVLEEATDIWYGLGPRDYHFFEAGGGVLRFDRASGRYYHYLMNGGVASLAPAEGGVVVNGKLWRLDRARNSLDGRAAADVTSKVDMDQLRRDEEWLRSGGAWASTMNTCACGCSSRPGQ